MPVRVAAIRLLFGLAEVKRAMRENGWEVRTAIERVLGIRV
ncbi:hypothetical protein [Thiorhodovibrio winogradskyi]|nr:hypothetical protein [Thiorhodovibrio winogradskyi]